MTTMPDILAVHRSNTQFCREIHAILPKADGGVEAGVPVAPALVPRIAHRSRADDFVDQEVAKGKKLRVVFDRAFKEMWEILTISKIADMEILDEVRGIQDEVETMTRKKDIVADLLGEEMEEHSGLRLDGERRL